MARKIINGPLGSKVVTTEDGTAIDCQATENYEATCPRCGKRTRFHSIDGGLTSIFRCSEGCNIEWVVSPSDDKTIRELKP